MKIVYLHQYFNTADAAGGVRSYEFARRLVRRGHEVHIVTSKREERTGSRTWEVTDVEGIQVHVIEQPYNNAMKARQRVTAFLRFAILAAFRARSLKGDVVFATSTPLTIAIPAIIATAGRRTPFVMEVRDLWPTVPIAMGYLRNPLARFSAKSLERIAYWKASKVIALSQGMAEGVAAAGFDMDKIAVIPNVSDSNRFQAASVDGGAFYAEHPQLSNRPFVVYTGTFGHVNGLEYMVDLAREYQVLDPQLAFVAMGEGGRKEAVAAYAERTGVLNRNFFVLDPVPKKELPNVLSASVACSSWVVPIKELEANSANKLFDAFAAGRPILINHGGWQDELLTSSGAGLVLSAASAKKSAELLHEHLSDASWLASARSSAEVLGAERFEVEKLFAEFEAVLVSA